MNAAQFSPYPHFSWLGTWKATGHGEARIEVGMRQVAHCLIYTGRGKADVTWQHSGGEDRFRVDAGTVRFCPADDDHHTVIGQRCEPGHRFYTLLIPQGHMVHVADNEGIATIPELRRSVSARDAVLTSCMRTLSNVHQHLDDTACERREAAALALLLRLLTMNGWRGPDWKNDDSVFPRRTLEHLVAYIDEHLQNEPSLSEMCLRVGLTPGHFAKKFRSSTGLSLRRFVQYRRVRSACSILRERVLPLESVAAMLGFSSHSHFTRTFTALTGMTPAKFRKNFRRGGAGAINHPRSAPNASVRLLNGPSTGPPDGPMIGTPCRQCGPSTACRGRW